MPRGKYDRKNSPWTKQMREFARAAASEDLRIVDLRDLVNSRFGKSLTYQQMKTFVYRYGLQFKRNTRHNILLTDEQAEYLIRIIPGRPTAAVTDMMNYKYGLSLTPAQIRGWKKNHHVPSGYDTRYRSGEPSWITGKKFPGRTNSGCWTSGHVSDNALPIGSIRKRGGYWAKKVQNGCLNDNWAMLHRLIWEEVHGPVPEDHVILFVDGNHDNLDPENLECVPKTVACMANMKYGMVKDEAEINRAILNVSALRVEIGKKRKGK